MSRDEFFDFFVSAKPTIQITPQYIRDLGDGPTDMLVFLKVIHALLKEGPVEDRTLRDALVKYVATRLGPALAKDICTLMDVCRWGKGEIPLFDVAPPRAAVRKEADEYTRWCEDR